MSRFLVAMTLFLVLGVAAWRSLSDSKMRVVTLAVIGSFAARTYLAHRNRLRAENEAAGRLVGNGDAVDIVSSKGEQGGGLK